MGVQNCVIPSTTPFPPSVWNPWGPPWQDQELERLRRMKRQAELEEEKRQIRDWLQRHGINPYPPTPLPTPFPMGPYRPCIPLPPPLPRPCTPCVDEVLRRIR